MTPVTASPMLDECFALRPDVYKGCSDDGRTFLLGWPAATAVDAPDELVEVVLDALCGPAVTMAQLRNRVPAADRDRRTLDAMVRQLRAEGWLEVTVTWAGEPIYTVAPDRRPPAPDDASPPAPLVLSRFTVLHREEGELLVESPRSWCRLRIHEPSVLGLVGSIGLAHDRAPIVGGEVPDELRERLYRDLWRAGLAVPPDTEEGALSHRQWGPHELWFHDRSRVGRRPPGRSFGATWWARGLFPAPPARREPFPGPRFALHRPDVAARQREDPPLEAVLDTRRTVRYHDDDRPITAEQLGELLFRTARATVVFEKDGFEYVGRPHPAGGGAGELEVYPVVRLVDGLEPGMYHYDSYRHELERVRPLDAPVARILRIGAMAAMMEERRPQVMLVVAARFGRLMWKYQEMPYAAILKHVGVLYQSWYLVATAMGLAPCGLGAGDAAAFAEATGLDPLVESSVGEFLIGSRHAVPIPEKVP